MAAISSAQSGNWNSGSTWLDGIVPGDGDRVTIINGHIVRANVNVTVGSNTANIGRAITINGSSPSDYGKLIVESGVTLTLKGNDDGANQAMIINRYGQLELQPGSTLKVDCASPFETCIENRGILTAIGTAQDRVTFTGQNNWNNAVVSESVSGTGTNYYPGANIKIQVLANHWISNAAGTGLGSFGDSSLSITNQSPAGICTTEVPSMDLVNGAGKYFVNYHMGAVFFYYDGINNTSFTAAYKYLTFNGWAIKATQDTTYNELKLDYCRFEYMGGTSSRQYALDTAYKKSSTVEANRQAYLKNSIVSFCRGFYSFRNYVGALGDEIKISGNTFNYCAPINFCSVLGITEAASSSYIDIEDNVLNCDSFVTLFNPYQTAVTYSNIRIRNNTGFAGTLITSTPLIALADGRIEGNNLRCFGGKYDTRMLSEVRGASGHHLIIRGNSFASGHRVLSPLGYVTFERNVITDFFHHFVHAPIADDVYCPDVLVRNNLWVNTGAGVGDSGIFETGYNHRSHLHNWRFIGNTIGPNMHAMLSLGDTQDGSTHTLITGLVVENNVIYQPQYGINRNVSDSDERNFVHALSIDNNLVYGPTVAQCSNFNQQATFMLGGARYNFDAARNVLGVALFDPSYSLPELTPRDLVFTRTSESNQTLAWGGGTAVQLVWDSGTASASAHIGGTTYPIASTLTDSSKSWSTTSNSAACPRMQWLKIIAGTGAGQIRAITNNTANQLTVTPAFTTLPSTDSQYVIIESEVQIFDAGGSAYVRAGIYLPELPTSSASDSGITITQNVIVQDPAFVNVSGATVDDFQLQSNSPAKDVGVISADLPEDYWETNRPQSSGVDMGFHEYVVSSSTPLAVSGGLTPAGSLSKSNSKGFDGGATPQGQIAKQIQKPISGAIEPDGGISKITSRTLLAELGMSGALDAIRTYILSLAASMGLSGILSRDVGKIFGGVTDLSASLSKSIPKSYVGALESAGLLALLKTSFLNLAGSLTPAGTMSRAIAKAGAGTISFVRSLSKQMTASFSGAVEIDGLLEAARTVSLELSGIVEPVGVVVKQSLKALTGTLIFARSLVKRINASYAGLLGLAGLCNAVLVAVIVNHLPDSANAFARRASSYYDAGKALVYGVSKKLRLERTASKSAR